MMFTLCVIVAYLCGSVPFGKIAGSMCGKDIQKHGSGNIGFANAVRVLGWKVALLVLIGDVGKGYLPVLVAARNFAGGQLLAVSAAAILGHIFPVWLNFKGGKGIATGLGVTLVLAPVLGAWCLIVYLLGFIAYRKPAVASLLAAWYLPILCFSLRPHLAPFYAILAVLVTWTHRHNVIRLLEGAAHVH